MESLFEEKLGINLRGNTENAFSLKFRPSCPTKFIQDRNPPKLFRYPHYFTGLHNSSHGAGWGRRRFIRFLDAFYEVSVKHC